MSETYIDQFAFLLSIGLVCLFVFVLVVHVCGWVHDRRARKLYADEPVGEVISVIGTVDGVQVTIDIHPGSKLYHDLKESVVREISIGMEKDD